MKTKLFLFMASAAFLFATACGGGSSDSKGDDEGGDKTEATGIDKLKKSDDANIKAIAPAAEAIINALESGNLLGAVEYLVPTKVTAFQIYDAVAKKHLGNYTLPKVEIGEATVLEADAQVEVKLKVGGQSPRFLFIQEDGAWKEDFLGFVFYGLEFTGENGTIKLDGYYFDNIAMSGKVTVKKGEESIDQFVTVSEDGTVEIFDEDPEAVEEEEVEEEAAE